MHWRLIDENLTKFLLNTAGLDISERLTPGEWTHTTIHMDMDAIIRRVQRRP